MRKFELEIDNNAVNEDIIKDILEFAQINVIIKEVTQRCHGPIHYGPFVYSPDGKTICTNCKFPVFMFVDVDNVEQPK